jgi:hypothetical protein
MLGKSPCGGIPRLAGDRGLSSDSQPRQPRQTSRATALLGSCRKSCHASYCPYKTAPSRYVPKCAWALPRPKAQKVNDSRFLPETTRSHQIQVPQLSAEENIRDSHDMSNLLNYAVQRPRTELSAQILRMTGILAMFPDRCGCAHAWYSMCLRAQGWPELLAWS